MIEPRLDHVVLAGPDLTKLVPTFWEQAGISPASGAGTNGSGR